MIITYFLDIDCVNNLQQTLGRLHFVGEHTSEAFNGYTHGGYDPGKKLRNKVLPRVSFIPFYHFGLLPSVGSKAVKATA